LNLENFIFEKVFGGTKVFKEVLDENVQIFNSFYQGYSNQKRWIRFSNPY